MAQIIFDAETLADLKLQFEAFVNGKVETAAQTQEIQPHVNTEAVEPAAEPKRKRRTKAEIDAAEAASTQASPIAQPEAAPIAQPEAAPKVEPKVEPVYTMEQVKAAAGAAYNKHGSKVYQLLAQVLVKEFGAANFNAFDKPEHVSKYGAFINRVQAITAQEAI